MHIVRAEDVMADSRTALAPVCEALGIEVAAALEQPSWNGAPMEEIYPWGTIRTPTPDANRATAEELSPAEREEVRTRAWQYLDVFGYADFLD
jgi:hypothetical protein